METIVINDENSRASTPQRDTEREERRDLIPQFEPEERMRMKCIHRGHLFGVLFPLQSYFNFYFSFLLHSLTLLSIFGAFLFYDPKEPKSLFLWDLIFIFRFSFQIMRLIDAILLNCKGNLDKTSFRIIHYLILSSFHILYYIGYKTKDVNYGFVGVLDFAYVLIINFFSVDGINRYECTLNELITLSVFTTMLSTSEEKSWALSLLMLTIATIVGLLILTAIVCQMHAPKQLAIFFVFYLALTSNLVMTYSLDSFSKDGKKWYLVAPCPFFNFISYIFIKGIVLKRYKSAKYRRITFCFVRFQANNILEAVRLTRMRVRDAGYQNTAEREVEVFDPTKHVKKKEQGAIDRMKGWIMKGPSLFKQITENDDEDLEINEKITKDLNNKKEIKKTNINTKNSVNKTGKKEVENKINDDGLCIICFADKPSTFYDPCSHAGICKTCALSIIKDNTTCPICRREVKSLIFYEKTEDGKYREIESLDMPKNREINIFVGGGRARRINMERTGRTREADRVRQND